MRGSASWWLAMSLRSSPPRDVLSLLANPRVVHAMMASLAYPRPVITGRRNEITITNMTNMKRERKKKTEKKNMAVLNGNECNDARCV
jgi:hypothetical protein